MTDNSPLQLSLGVSIRDDATFANFFCVDKANAQVVAALTQIARGEELSNHIIWGGSGSGLTHLLHAVCHQGQASGREIVYLPLSEMVGFSAAEICDGLEYSQLICLDGIEHICGHRQWEQALFHLFNNVKDAGHTLLLASHTSPPSLPIVLPDLKSRVLGCVNYHVDSLTDSGKHLALRERAAARGMALTEDVTKFILSRASRNTNELFNVLNRLDEASLQQQRKLTIPFVKEVLGI